MDTAEARTTTSGAAGGPVYDAFLSYSHAADELLAPRLQAGLQRFAKPWWKRRALRIFRDEASLSANPHLWSSITEALDESGWFVLLLSPEAAESPWVNREVEYWLDQKDPERIIPVVTEGEFTWSATDLDLESTAAPPALYGAFPDEPRWVDLRFAHSEEQLDLKNPRFSAAVADVASAIREVPKDELESEEVRQHRRTVRTAWAAGVVVVLFAMFSAAAALFALDQRNEAEAAAEAEAEQRLAAEEARAAESEQRIAAEEQRAEAERQAAIALESAQLARSRELAASAINVLDEDPELSLLLALQAARGADPAFESVSALHEAIQNHRIVRAITWPAESVMDPAVAGSISPDGRYVVVSGAKHQLAVYDLGAASDEPIWTFEVPWPDHAVILPYFTSDGAQVVASVAWFKYDESPEEWPDPPADAGVYVFDTETGEVLRHIRGPDCPIIGLFQSGPFLDETRPVGAGAPAAEDCSHGLGVHVWLVDLASGEMTLGYDGPVYSSDWGTPASLSEDGRYLSYAGGTSNVVDLETGEVIFEAPGGEHSLVSRDGSRLLAAEQRSISLWDIGSGAQLWKSAEAPAYLTSVSFSEDESLIQSGGWDGAVRVWDAGTGELLHEFGGHRAFTWAGSLTTDNSKLASFSGDRTVRIWDLTASAEGEIAGFDLPGFPVVQSGHIVGGRAAALLYPDLATAYVEPGAAIIFDPSTGEIEHRLEGYGGEMVRLSADGTLLAGQPFVTPRLYGPVHIRDVESGEVLVELEDLCTWDVEAWAPGPDCTESPETVGDFFWSMDFSPDGSMLAMHGNWGYKPMTVGVWDVESGRRLVWLTDAIDAQFSDVTLRFSPDSDLLLTAGEEFIVFETEGWSEVARAATAASWWDLLFTPDGHQVWGGDAIAGIVTIDTNTWEHVGDPLPQEGIVRDLAVNSDGSLIASTDFDGFVRIFSAETRELTQTIPLGKEAVGTLIDFIDDRHLLVIPQGRPALVITIDVPELVGIARSQVTRGFTEQECTTYHLDPCPTLEDIQSGSA
jgi:WD40 repeat protein